MDFDFIPPINYGNKVNEENRRSSFDLNSIDNFLQSNGTNKVVNEIKKATDNILKYTPQTNTLLNFFADDEMDDLENSIAQINSNQLKPVSAKPTEVEMQPLSTTPPTQDGVSLVENAVKKKKKKKKKKTTAENAIKVGENPTDADQNAKHGPQKANVFERRAQMSMKDKKEASIKKIKSEKMTEEMKHRYRVAACYVNDAVQGRDFRHRTDEFSLKVLWVLRSTPYKLFYFAVTAILFLLTCFEAPAMFTVPFGVTQGIELFIMVVLFIECIVKIFVTSRKIFILRNAWNLSKILVIILTVADIIAYILTLEASIRFTRILRPMFLASRSKNIQGYFKYLAIVIRKMFEIIIFIVVLVVMYSAFGRMVFVEDPYFITFFDACVNMFALLTTVNFPDIMLPSYRVNKLSCLYFISFLVIGIYLTLNLALALVYNFYRKSAKAEALTNWKERKTALYAAFVTIDTEKRGYIDYTQWRRLFRYVKPHAKPGEAKAIFDMVDMNGNGIMEPIDFLQLCDVLMNRVKEDMAIPVRFIRIYERLWRPVFPFLRQYILESKYYRFFSTLVILCSLAINIYVISVESVEVPQWTYVVFHVLDSIILIVFVLDVVANILGYGVIKYWRRGYQKVDFFIVLLSVFTKIFVEFILAVSLPVEISHGILFQRIKQFLRFFRFFRLFCVSLKLRSLASTYFDIVVLMGFFASIIFIDFYIFAIIGMELFAGKVVRGDPAIIGLDYDKADYYDLVVFDDFGRTLVTLFSMLIINNWHITMRAYITVTTHWHVIYFVVFYFTSITFILNLLIAFIIEAFMFKWGEKIKDTEEKLEREKAIDEKLRLAKRDHTNVESSWRVRRKTVTNASNLSYQIFKEDDMDKQAKSAQFITERSKDLEQQDTELEAFGDEVIKKFQKHDESNKIGILKKRDAQHQQQLQQQQQQDPSQQASSVTSPTPQPIQEQEKEVTNEQQ